MRRVFLFIGCWWMAPTLLTAVTLEFVRPQPGAQTIGPQLLEVRTDAAYADRVEFRVDGTLAGVARRAPWRIAHDFGSDLAPHTIVATLYADGYRTTTTASVQTAAIGATDSYNVDLVEVPLRVHTSGLLRASDIRVRENGVLQTLRDVKPERGDAQFVFIIDRSLSMGEGKLAAALRAIDTERQFLRTGDTVAAILFNHNVDRPRTIVSSEKFFELYNTVVPSGGTSLRDALAAAPRAARTYAIVITDGGDRNSMLSDEQSLRRISGTRTVVDALLLGGDDSPFLDRAAKNTGGEVVHTSARGVRESLHRLISDINSRYSVSYQSHGTATGWRTISIEPVRRGVEIFNGRKGYFAE